jgi:hypothetical protein
MENWLVLQNFYEGLTPMSKEHIDAAARGAFLSLTINEAMNLINKMVANCGWGEERSQPKQEDMHTVKETDVLVTRMDLLLKRLDERAAKKRVMYGTVKAMDSHMICEVCGDVGHSKNDCPKTREATYINNGYNQHGGQNGWNQQSRPLQGGNLNFNSIYNSNEPSLRNIVLSQAKTIENLKEKLKIHDKMLELMNYKIEDLAASIKNQLSFKETSRNTISLVCYCYIYC